MDRTNQLQQPCESLQVQIGSPNHLELTITMLSNCKIEVVCKKTSGSSTKSSKQKHAFTKQTVDRIRLKDKTQQSRIGLSSSVIFPLSSPPLFGTSSSFEHDMDTVVRLLGLRPFEIEILDLYVSSIVTQHEDQQNRYKYLSPLFMPDLREQPVEALMHNYDSLKIDDFNIKHMIWDPISNATLIAPIYAFRHFYLAIFDFENRQIDVYDSLWMCIENKLRVRHIKYILKWLVIKLQMDQGDDYLLESQNWSINLQNDCSQQKDDQTCGYFVAYFVENIINGHKENCIKTMYSKALIKTRNNILQNLLGKTETGQKVLNAILI